MNEKATDGPNQPCQSENRQFCTFGRFDIDILPFRLNEPPRTYPYSHVRPNAILILFIFLLFYYFFSRSLSALHSVHTPTMRTIEFFVCARSFGVVLIRSFSFIVASIAKSDEDGRNTTTKKLLIFIPFCCVWFLYC